MTEQPITPRREPVSDAEIRNKYGESIQVWHNAVAPGPVIEVRTEFGTTAWAPDDRLQALAVAAQILEADLAEHPDDDQDGRFLALDALRGFITDQRDAADDEKVAAFYEGQYAAESREVVVSFSALPSEDKRLWRRKFQAAAVTVR